MDINAIYEDKTREELVQELCDSHRELTRLKTMLTNCGEEMHRLGSDRKDLLGAIEAGEAKWITGYSIGSYNQMRDYILNLEKGLCLRPKHIDYMFKARSDYVPQASETKSPAEAMHSLQNECIELRQVMVAAAEEIHEHWKAHCDEEGYGPANLMRRLEQGIAVCYPGYTIGAFQKLENKVEMLNRRLENVRAYRERKAKEQATANAPASELVPEAPKASYCPWKISVVNSGDAQVLRLVKEVGDEVYIVEIPVESGDAHDANLSVLHQFVNSVSKTMHMTHKWPMWWKVSEVNTLFRVSMPGRLCYTIVPVEMADYVALGDFFRYLGAVYD